MASNCSRKAVTACSVQHGSQTGADWMARATSCTQVRISSSSRSPLMLPFDKRTLVYSCNWAAWICLTGVGSPSRRGCWRARLAQRGSARCGSRTPARARGRVGAPACTKDWRNTAWKTERPTLAFRRGTCQAFEAKNHPSRFHSRRRLWHLDPAPRPASG